MAESVVNGHNEVVSATVDESIIDIPADAAPAAVEETEEASASLTPAQRLQLAADAEEAAAPKNKNHGKAPQKNREATHIDVASDSAFPSLGGGPSKASIAPVKWGAGAGPVLVSASSAPAESNWSPAVKSAGGQQTVFTLLKGDRRAPADMRRSQQDLVRDIARKTGTKIEVATNISRGSSTYVISGSSADDRDRAKRELRRELTATVTRSVSVPAVTRSFIIGKGGSKIQELQQKTLTNVKVPQYDAADMGAAEHEDEAMIDVLIEGDSEGCEKAAELITKIVKERVIKITRSITASGKLYPFIQGQDKSNIQKWEELVDKVLVPDYFHTTTPAPKLSEPSGPILVIGEKSAVEQVVAQIKEMISSLEAEDYPVRGTDINSHEPQLLKRNNYQIIREVFAETGCSVILPPPNVFKAFIVGPSSKVADGLSAILRKLEGYNTATLDLCTPFKNAPNGAKVHAIDVVRHIQKTSRDKVIEKDCDVDITYPQETLYDLTKPCLITIIGKTKENVNTAKKAVMELFGAYTPKRISEMEVEPLYFKHILGKDGKGPKKISAATSVEILFPQDPEDDRIALVYEGPSTDEAVISEALEKAKEGIREITKGQVEIVKKVLEVPQELHDKLRGERNTIINALNPTSIFVQFGAPTARFGRPAPAADSGVENTITLRGPPGNVATMAANINAFLKDTEGQDAPAVITEQFEYPRQYSGNLIGSKGSNINKLRDDLGVEIRLDEGNGKITGVRVCVDAARKKLNAQLKELEDKAVITIKVPQQYHGVIVGSEGSTVRRLEERYNVRINFPKKSEEDGPRQAPDEIIIRGNKKGAQEASQEITELWKYEADNNHTATITVLAKSVGYMFKNASKDIKRLREETSARIIIPQEDKNSDPESTVEIRIRGTKKDVDHAKTVLSKIAQNAENTTARTISVDKKYHKSLIGPGGSTLRDIVVNAGGPDDRAALARLVRFPNQASESNDIVVQGSTDIVDKIVEAIENIVAEKENQVTEVIQVAPERHRKLIGREGIIRRELEAKFAVTLGIPRQRPGQPQTNPDISITGEPSAVEDAKAHILELTEEPEGETLEVPRRLHHAIADGGLFKQLQREFKVTVDHNGLPRPTKPEAPKPKTAQDMPLITDEADEDRVFWEIVENSASTGEEETYPWVLRGSNPANVAKAKAEIEKAVAAAAKQSHTGFLILPDPRKYRFVIGPGGSTVDRIRRETGCRITVPHNNRNGGSGDGAITLNGDKAGLEKAKDAILEAVKMGDSNGNNGGRRGGDYE
ncbi:hypothetical protein BZA05DRAFT_474833 [Tricharina praecox]|uniref:uncharacterized protein n=1 Tax=Tricharina praecox TaxID=43433 RepID=UPI00221E9B22|nr:uncharacterized protein BZA05DRAFT_474833 [Tricharina praecox]KAI5849828.1 hypothetical protein BZA05DRAFT_474833 [Tricharina praecox]